jgi:DNA/RNA endonuclease G (NUC1)
MKNIFLILLLSLTTSSVAQTITDKSVVKIDKGIYQVEYSEFFKNPLKVTYKIYNFKNNSDVERKGSFYKEEGIITANAKDFESNVYDKGHLAPAETFSNTHENMKKTFSYVNCALQHYRLNRGLWKILEQLERKISLSDSIKIINTVIFEKPYKQLVTGAYVPSKFRKEIIMLSTNKRMIYEFPNDETTHSIYDYIKLNEVIK